MKKAKETKSTAKKKGTTPKSAVKLNSMQLNSGKKSSAKSSPSKGVTAKAAPKKASVAAKSAPTPKVTAATASSRSAIATKVAPNGAAPVRAASSVSHNGKTAPVNKGFSVGTVSAATPNFKVNEKVVYPAHGVGIIDSIEIRVVGGTEHKFYMITILETGMKIMVPLAQVDTVGLRRVVDEKTIEKVYDILRDRNVVVDTQTWNRRYREYTQKLKTGSLFEIAKVIRDLSVLRFDKELSFGERKMLDTAQGLLVKEISIAKARPEDKIKQEIQEFFHAA